MPESPPLNTANSSRRNRHERALGATALEQAIGNLAGEVKVELTFKPFELGSQSVSDYEQMLREMSAAAA